jgi:DNA-binding transcriptional ArsR family regulator
MKYASLDHFFTILGNKQRVSLLQLLGRDGPKSVSAITKALESDQSAVSHNLKRLLLCHFVTVQQVGKERIYSINEDTVKPLFELIDKHVSKYCAENCKHGEK